MQLCLEIIWISGRLVLLLNRSLLTHTLLCSTPAVRTASRPRRRREPSPRPPTSHSYSLRNSSPDNLVSAATTMSGHLASTTAAASAAIPATSVPLATYSTTPPLASTLGPPSSAPPHADSSAAASVPAAALDTLTAAIYGLQRQMG